MNCPICNHNETQPLLTLEHTPIYQHPLTPECHIPLPHYLDLEYRFCTHCGHGLQSQFDKELMDKIYANHYYTPAPDSIGHQFRDEFFTAIETIVANQQPGCRILEIGSSSGELLAIFRQKISNPYLMGYEPSHKSAIAARQLDIPTRCEFFTPQSVQQEHQEYDIIVSRHVIEHIVDFSAFMEAIAHVSHENTRLILETPSLDDAMLRPNIAPFHVEHAHVFSAYSLAKLAANYGWFSEQHNVTSGGNLILCFTRDRARMITIPPLPFNNRLQELLHWQAQRLTQEIGMRKIILWGADSGGTSLICIHNLHPELVVDGNPNKQGKKFCGQPWIIQYGPEAIVRLQQDSNCKMEEYCIIIGSAFYKEIRAQLAELNWRGGIISPYEWCLSANQTKQ